MKIAVELNIADVMAAIQQYVEKHIPNTEVTGVRVTSWNTIIFEAEDGILLQPCHHVIKDAYKRLP